MYKILFYLLLIFGISTVQSQEKIITGIVSDTSGGMPGVSIVIKGTSNGTQTDFDGKYSIKTSIGDILVFTYLGYKGVKRKVGKSSIINVVLKEDSQMLEEIVVIGYGSSKRKSYTTSSYSVSSIKVDKRKAYHNKISNALKGRVAGVEIKSENRINNPIKIRGAASISKTKTPLYIVDGVPIQSSYNTIIKNLNKDDIKKVNIYKSYKAKNIFGESAKNGCIVITTKQGNYRLENQESYAQIHENQFKRVALNRSLAVSTSPALT